MCEPIYKLDVYSGVGSNLSNGLVLKYSDIESWNLKLAQFDECIILSKLESQSQKDYLDQPRWAFADNSTLVVSQW